MKLTILFIGDIVGSLGRQAVKKLLPKLKRQYQPDLAIANVENLAHGTGITEKTWQEMRDAGIDYGTSGNHVFDRPGFEPLLNDERFHLLRPANYPETAAGTGVCLIPISKTSKKTILLINLMGRVFLDESLVCPFRTFDEIWRQHQNQNVSAIVVDLHAEATSEKKALGHYVAGRATAVLGTHTHVQTADETILPDGTAYISDVGMVGAADSIIGVVKEKAIHNFLYPGDTVALTPAETGGCLFNAALITINTETKKATKIKRVNQLIS